MRAIIAGTGIYLPDNVVDNHTLSKVMDTTDEWVRQRTGIETRCYADLDETTSDLASRAAEAAIADAGIEKEEIDYIVFATMTPDYYVPGAGPFMQKKLGLTNVPCLDIRQQCAGFVFGLQVVDALIRSGQYKNILLIGAEVHSGMMPWESWDVILGTSDRQVTSDEFEWNTLYRDRTVLFGDGAGACVIQAVECESRGVQDVLLFTDGELYDKIWANAGGSAFRPYFSPQQYESGDIVPMIKGREVFKLAVTLMPDAVMKILEKNGISPDELDMVIMHQANLRINESIQKRMGLSDSKVFNNIQKYGNTTAATIPLAYHEALKEGRIKEGDLVCFVALGSGLHWGAVLYRA